MSSVPQSDPARPLFLRTLARPRAIALGCIALLAAGGWGYLGLVLAGQQSSSIWRALCQPIYGLTGGMSLAGASLTFAMWCAMVLATMLPTAAPMVTTYADLTEAAAAKGEPTVSAFVLSAGYLAVWLGAAVLLTALQGMLLRLDMLDVQIGFANPFIAGALFLAAGAYQFSSAKRACLTHCQHPFRFFFANWTSSSSRRISHRRSSGALLPWMLLGDDAFDVRGRRNECRVDGHPRNRDGHRETRCLNAL